MTDIENQITKSPSAFRRDLIDPMLQQNIYRLGNNFINEGVPVWLQLNLLTHLLCSLVAIKSFLLVTRVASKPKAYAA